MPAYLAQLGENLSAENQRLQTEAAAIAAHVGHIRNIVAAQQTYARRGGVTEAVDVAELLDNAVAIHFADMTDVIVRREYEPLAPLTIDRHKLIQILGNLLSNARHAFKDTQTTRREHLTLRVRRQESRVRLPSKYRIPAWEFQPDVLAPAVRVWLHDQEGRPRLRPAHQRDPGQGTCRRARGVQRWAGARRAIRAAPAGPRPGNEEARVGPALG